MLLTSIVLSLAVFIAAAAGVLEVRRWLRRRRPALHREVVVSLATADRPGAGGEPANSVGVRGVLTGYEGDWLRIECATWLAEGAPPTEVEGSVLVPRWRVLVMQQPPSS